MTARQVSFLGRRILMRWLSNSWFLLAIASVLVVSPTFAQDDADSFRDSDFDGHWSGSLRVAGVDTPMAINLSVTDDLALASVMLPDATDRSDTFEPYPTVVQRLGAQRLDLVIDTGRQGDGSGTARLVVSYRSGSDSLKVKATGALRGRGALQRSQARLPLRGIWGGDLLLALSEISDGARALDVTEVTGFAWSEAPDLRGPVAGSRDGDGVALTILTPSGKLEFGGELRASDTQLRGELSASTGAARAISLLRASGLGAMRLRGFSPVVVSAGMTSAVTLSGRNLAEGLQVDADVDGVSVTAARVESTSSALLSVAVDASVAPGTRIGLRIRNADGQAAIAASALTVGDTPPGLLSFTANIEPILANGCTYNGCHTVQKAPQTAGLILAEGAYDNTVDVASTQQPWLMRIRPGDADASYLVKKIRGDADIDGARMPRDGPDLLPGEIQMIIDWVNQGAARDLSGR